MRRTGVSVFVRFTLLLYGFLAVASSIIVLNREFFYATCFTYSLTYFLFLVLTPSPFLYVFLRKTVVEKRKRLVLFSTWISTSLLLAVVFSHASSTLSTLDSLICIHGLIIVLPALYVLEACRGKACRETSTRETSV